MRNLTQIRAEISAILAEIEHLQPIVRVREADDCEAYDIVRRIERKLKSKGMKHADDDGRKLAAP